ncbi:hypothetical protein ACFL2H_04855 [Planctomycetota bacterium]
MMGDTVEYSYTQLSLLPVAINRIKLLVVLLLVRRQRHQRIEFAETFHPIETYRR